MAVELKKPSTFRQYKTLLRKDLEQEFRTKEMLTSMGIYALLVIIVYGAALAQTSQTTDVLQMSGGLLWALIVFTSLLGLNRSFAHEKEQGCMEGILLVPMDRSVVFLAKSTSNLLFLLVVEVIAVPLFYFFFLTTTTPSESFWLLVVPLLVGTVGVAGIGTLLSTITINTRGLPADGTARCCEAPWRRNSPLLRLPLRAKARAAAQHGDFQHQDPSR